MMYLVGFVLSVVFAFCWTPLMRRAALQLGLVDQPDGNLKNHPEAVPYLGGLAIYAAFLLTAGVVTDFQQETLGLLLSGSIVLLVGLIDDFGVLTPSQKLLGQTLAALVLVRSGTYIRLEFLPWYVAILLTVLWILAVTNALNIIDVMDGLAAGVSAIAALTLALANAIAGRNAVALLAVILAGATLGFLRHNFHPAKIYLGDAGSLFVGFMLAALSLNAGYTRHNLLALFSPILILGLPLFDLALVSYIRWTKGRHIIYGSPDHFALRLQRWKLSVPEVVAVAYSAGILLGAAALIMSQVTLGWAVVTLVAALSAGLTSAYLLMKVDIAS